MQLRQALEAAVRRLEENAVGSPRMNAEVLLMFTLGCDRAHLYAHPERELEAAEMARYDEALSERARGVPAQYIVGHQEFWGLDLIVNPAVLIPRPETEHVVEAALDLVKEGNFRTPKIVDVGTGSGCVALALAHELPQAEIWATEISEAALEVARANAARLELETRVRFVHADLLTLVEPTSANTGQRWGSVTFDFVVSNPPYVGEGEADKMQREVRKFEPQQAVFAGADGLDLIRRLIPEARLRLNPGGWLLMEIGYTQEQQVRAMLSDWAEVRSVPDLQGIPRVIAAKNS